MDTNSISQLLDDINSFRATVIYLENRILRKQIAIQEIMSGNEIRQDQSPPPKPSAPENHPNVSAGPTVRAMVESILPELNGSVFWYSDIKSRCLAKYPDHTDKIRRGMHQACYELINHNVLEKCPGGIRVK